MNEIAYTRQLCKVDVIPEITTDQMYYAVLEKAGRDIPGFKLSKENEKIFISLCQYFTGDTAFEKDGKSLRKGILLFGAVGCGKTTLMKLFMHNPRASFVMKSCREVAAEFTKNGEEVLFKYSRVYEANMVENPFKTKSWGICFDDLGTEDIKKHYGNESNVMENVLLNRYDRIAEIPYRTHTTTNISGEQMGEYYGTRVRSRIREMFNSFELDGGDLRK